MDMLVDHITAKTAIFRHPCGDEDSKRFVLE